MRRTLFRGLLIGLPVLLVLLAGTYFFLSQSKADTGSVQQTTIGKGITLSPVVDQLSQQVLTNMHDHAWNPDAMTRTPYCAAP